LSSHLTLEIDFLSPESLHRAADLAMDYFDKQQSTEPPKIPAVLAALAEINARARDIREQFKEGKIPGAVYKSWLAELAKERDAINRPAMPKPPRISRSEFLQEYKSAVARKLKVFTSRENVAMSCEALREVLAERKSDLATGRRKCSLRRLARLEPRRIYRAKANRYKVGSGGRIR